MKTLLLMRHAKSSWNHPELTDYDRPLKRRGRNDAHIMSRVIDENDLYPDLILSSSAKRAAETAEALIEGLEYENEIIFSETLYMAEPHDFIEVLKNLDNDIETVMIIAHNPGLEDVLQIIGDKYQAMPTAALGYLVLNLESWDEISFETTGKLAGFWTPKMLKDKAELE